MSNQDQESCQIYLNQKEVAALIRKKPRWLERARCVGGGPPFCYVGRSPIYKQSDVLQWMADLPVLNNTAELPAK